MNSSQLHPQYLLNAQGEKNYVVLSIEEYEALLEATLGLTALRVPNKKGQI